MRFDDHYKELRKNKELGHSFKTTGVSRGYTITVNSRYIVY